MNNFIIDYTKKELSLNYQGETFEFDLNDGDVGDFWHSFTTKDGVLKDINFSQENENESPSIGIYGVIEQDGELAIDTDDSEFIVSAIHRGAVSDYFM